MVRKLDPPIRDTWHLRKTPRKRKHLKSADIQGIKCKEVYATSCKEVHATFWIHIFCLQFTGPLQ